MRLDGQADHDFAGRLHAVERDPATVGPERADVPTAERAPAPGDAERAATTVDTALRDAEADESAETEADEADDDDDDEIVLPWWQHPVNIVALIVAAALIAGMVGWLIASVGAESDANDVDIGFMQDMRIHHEQAVAMSFMFLDRPDTEPGLRTVARSIVLGQGIDIGRMIQLLREAGAPEAATSDEAMAWMGMSTTHEAMPGMATTEQLDELVRSEGADADQLFVDLMVAHHEGGIHMSEYAAEHAGEAEVRHMADAMAHSQRDEIAELQGLVD
jgi:uncharacterized protein (DUF305 family)